MTNWTLWPDSQVPGIPGAADSQPILLGTRFAVNVDGWVTHLRFWKHFQNTPYGNGWTGRPMFLWKFLGAGAWTQIASVISYAEDEVVDGWQNTPLATPVALEVGELYTVSCTAPAMVYSAQGAYFTTDYTPGGGLWAPSSDSIGGNGVYHYLNPGDDPGTLCPGNTFNATTYFIDVVFTDVDPSAPPVTVDFKSRESGAWVDRTAVPKVRVDGAWVVKRPKRWDSGTSSWIDLP